MDFRFTPEQEELRLEIKEFAKKELPPDWYGSPDEEYADENWEFTRQMAKKLARKGWLVLSWPKEYGGRGKSVLEQAIYQDEMFYYGIPGTGMGVSGIGWVGPCLMLFGTEEQKGEHLPKIASGDSFWCTGYSEPGAGSDLGALQCRAVADGDDYVINGQKVWTSAGHISDWCWLAVRTNTNVPKHKGISLLLVDMKSKGITVRPLLNLAGFRTFNEVFFDDVRVPKKNLVGQENKGWYYIVTALDFERVMPGIRSYSTCRRILDKTISYIKNSNPDDSLANNTVIRNKLAELAAHIEAGRLLSYRVAWMQSKGEIPNYEASLSKVYNSELIGKAVNTALNILGLYGQLLTDSKYTAFKGWLTNTYMIYLGSLIAAGTSEVQRNIVAQRGLGLPRD